MGKNAIGARRTMLLTLAILVGLCLLAVIGMVQIDRIANLHTLNIEHLQAVADLEQELQRLRPGRAALDPARLRASIEQIRRQPVACLDSMGIIERLELSILGSPVLLDLCRKYIRLADEALAALNGYQDGAIDRDAVLITLARASAGFRAHSQAFLDPVRAFIDRLRAAIVYGMIIVTLLGASVILYAQRLMARTVDQLEKSHRSLLESEARNSQLALYDSLTGLPNRNLFMDRLGQAIVAAKRGERIMALLYVDLDNFKQINDTLGHEAGDELLREMARRMLAMLRGTDTVARLGGDEFAIILNHIAHKDDAKLVAQRVLEAAAKPIRIREVEHVVGASIGITCSPQDGTDGSQLLKNADMAMYEAKSAGRNDFRFYSQATDERTRLRTRNQSLLRSAPANGELRLHFQPIVDLQSGDTIGAEALLRWQHPDDGLVYPDSFIDIAEESGSIVEIGDWVLNDALAQCRRWQAAKPEFSIAVNVSVRQLRNASFVDRLAAQIESHGLAAASLHLEITESLFLTGDDLALSSLHMLGELGVVLNIDDFGAGYSSFSYLRQLPFRVLKIDRSFIRGVPDNRDACAVAAAILNMSQSLGLKVIAEGVESERHLGFLVELGCPFAQGYLFAKPMSAERFDPLRSYPLRASA